MGFHLPSLSFGKFTTSEVASVAGMAKGLVRLWRSRGHIAAKEGRGAVYSAIELAEITIRYDLSRYGLAPKDSEEVGRKCAERILQNVMVSHGGACEVRGPAEAVAWIRDVHQNSDRLTNFLFGGEIGEELLVKTDDDEEFSFRPSASPGLEMPDYRSALILNMEGYAARLAKMAQGPIIILRFDCGGGANEIRSTLAED